MSTKASTWLAVLFVLLGLAGGIGRAAESSAWAEKLKAVPPNTWISLAPNTPQGEVGVAYDPDHDYLLRYGGCSGDRGTYEDDHYANDLWLFDCRAGKWMMRRAVHMYACGGRPTNGCNRGFTYDSTRKRFWLVWGIANAGHGGSGEMCAYDPETDRFEGFFGLPSRDAAPAPDSTLMTYDAKNDLVLWLNGRCGKLSIFDPKTKKWRVSAKPAPGISTFNAFFFDSKRSRAVCLGPRGKGMGGWAYDAAADAWADVLPGNADSVPPRSDFGAAYDSKNDVAVMVSGFKNSWGSTEAERGEKRDTWVLDFGKNEWTEMKPPTQPQCAAFKNCTAYDAKSHIVLAGMAWGLWGYRYK